MEAHDHLIPVSTIARRLENHRDELRRVLAATPRWRWHRRAQLAGAAAAYDYELSQTLEITSRWQPFWRAAGFASPRTGPASGDGAPPGHPLEP